MTKKYLILWITVVLFLTGTMLFSLKFNSFTVFPFDKISGISINTSHEAVLKGYSNINYYFEKDSSISFDYELSKTIQEPIVALYFHKLDVNKKYFDFSDFNEISIYLKSKKSKRIPIYITIDYERINKKSGDFLSLPLVYVIDYIGEGEYKIAKSDLQIPSWWLRYHGIKAEKVGELDFKKVDYVLVNSCQVLGAGLQDSINVKKIAFSNSNKLNYYFYASLILLWLLLGLIVFFYRKRKKILIPYKIKELIQNPNGTKLEQIMNYIGLNFANPDLSVTDIQLALGISTREIGVIIKDELNSNFKTFLNNIRLTEVKRLLLESDLSISEIAYNTGYSNISHFNRIFKKEFEMSPSEFREKNIENK